MIRPARADEASALSSLAVRSKSYWEYSPSEMQVFRDELWMEPAVVEARSIHVLEENDELVGFYSLIDDDAGAVELKHLFIEPGRLGQGYGRRLFEHAIWLARERGYRCMRIQSDPNAEGFYVALGHAPACYIDSSIPGRQIPCFELPL